MAARREAKTLKRRGTDPNQPNRLLYIIEQFQRSHLEGHVGVLINAFHGWGFAVDVLTDSIVGDLTDQDGLTVAAVGSSHQFRKFVLRNHRRYRLALVYNHRRPNTTLALLALTRRLSYIIKTDHAAVPLAFTFRPRRMAWRLIGSYVPLRLAAVVLAESSRLADASARVTRSPIVEFPNGVWEGDAQRVPEPTGEERTLLFLGRLDPIKNLPLLIRSFAAANPPGWKLRIVGPDADDDLRQELQRLVEDLRVQGAVELGGAVYGSDKDREFTIAAALVLPSRSEGGPQVVLEAMVRGRPVIASSVGQIPEQIGDAGLLVPPSDGDALTDAIRTLTSDRELRLALARRGKERALVLFSWERSLDRFRAALEARRLV